MKKTNGKGKKKGTVGQREVAFFVKEIRQEGLAVLRRKIAYVTNFTAVTGNPVSAAYTTGTLSSCSAWSGLAADYNEFRCRAIRVTFVPRFHAVLNMAVAAINVDAFPGALITTRAVAGLAPPSLGAAVDWDGAEMHNGNTGGTIKALCTWESNPTSKLWTLTAVALPADRYLGCYIQNTYGAPATYNGHIVLDILVEYDLEFRGRSA